MRDAQLAACIRYFPPGAAGLRRARKFGPASNFGFGRERSDSE